jgi:prepilin-type N-terminal cleavage/methylation domain-containing protein
VAASKGYTLVELVAVLAILAMAVAVALPAAAMLRDGGRAAAGARTMATLLSAQRWKSVAAHRVRGLQFRRDASGWTWREVADGNGNGLRTAEITRGIDPILSVDDALGRKVQNVTLGIPTRRLRRGPTRSARPTIRCASVVPTWSRSVRSGPRRAGRST